jgi:type I restriction enzyme S subunit
MKKLWEVGVAVLDCHHLTPRAQEDGYPYVAIPDLKGGHIDFDGARRISAADFRTWTKKTKPQAGDVIVTRRGRVGDTAVVPQGVECALGQDLVILRSDGGHIDQRFLRWVTRGPQWEREVDRFLNVGAVFDSLNVSDLPKFEIPVPSLPIQRRIADTLDLVDRKAELNREMSETLEGIARAIFTSWFVAFDPVRAKMEGRPLTGVGAEFAGLFPDNLTNSELGPIPRGWSISSIREEYQHVMGQSPPGSSYNETGDGVPLFQGKGEFGFRYPIVRLFCTEPKRMASAGDTLVSVRAPVGAMNLARVECCIGRGLAAVRHKSGSASFTYYSLRELTDAFTAYDSEGTVFGSINKKDFGEIRCLQIPESLVLRVNELLSPIDALIGEKEEEQHTLAELRDALLPRLVSGEIRVEDAEQPNESSSRHGRRYRHAKANGAP